MRQYQALGHIDDAPQLPTGLAGISLIAPLWSRVMDPTLVAYACGDLNRINLHPPARVRLHRKWGASWDASAA